MVAVIHHGEPMEHKVIVEAKGTAGVTVVPFFLTSRKGLDPGFEIQILGLTLMGDWESEEEAQSFVVELVQDAARFLANFEIPKTPENLEILFRAIQEIHSL